LSESIYTQFVSGKVEQRKHQGIYMGNSQRRKIIVKKEITLTQRDYKEFSALYYKFNFLGFDPLQKRKRVAFIAKG